MSTSNQFAYRSTSPAQLADTGPVLTADLSSATGASVYAATLRIDTGASSSWITQAVADHLGLVAARHDDVVGPDGKTTRCAIHELRVSIRKPDGLGIIGAFDASMRSVADLTTSAPIDGVLGRDFMHNIQLSYDGRAGVFYLVNAVDEARRLRAIDEQRQAKRRAHANRKKDKADLKKGRRKRKLPPTS